MSLHSSRVCAIVVTFNRADLLETCLKSILSQEKKPDGIVVVNNSSTDHTLALLEEHFPQVEVLSLPENVGGAGGFCAGIQFAFANGYDWFWLMDDDTFPQPRALATLVEAYNTVPQHLKPEILNSRVLWTDNTIHPMNIPVPSYVYPKRMNDLRMFGFVSIRCSSFVSILISRSAVIKHGLPLAEYFIWNDDVEFVSRVTRQDVGLLVPESKAIHATKARYMPLSSSGERFYFEVRNKLWMLWHSGGWTWPEKLGLASVLIYNMLRYVFINRFSQKALAVVKRGCQDGFVQNHPTVKFLSPQNEQSPSRSLNSSSTD